MRNQIPTEKLNIYSPSLIRLQFIDMIALHFFLSLPFLPCPSLNTMNMIALHFSTPPLFKHDVPAGARSIELKTNDGKTHSFKLDVRNGADIHKVWSFNEGKFVGK